MGAAAVLLIAGLLGAPARADEVEDLLRGVDDLNRGKSAHSVIEMQVHTASYDRMMRMEAWSQGTDNTLIRILYPEKDAGICTLKVNDNLWNYLPKVDRTIKVPAGMMSGAWMGSHVTNDDLVRDSRLSDDFTYAITERPTGSTGKWVIQLVPKPDAAIVWGKVVVHIGADKLPLETTYYDEAGALVRTLKWSQVEVMDGRRMPTVFTIIPADKPGEYTTVRQLAIDFDADIDPSTFTLQALKP